MSTIDNQFGQADEAAGGLGFEIEEDPPDSQILHIRIGRTQLNSNSSQNRLGDGDSPICSADCAKLGQSPTVLTRPRTSFGRRRRRGERCPRRAVGPRHRGYRSNDNCGPTTRSAAGRPRTTPRSRRFAGNEGSGAFRYCIECAAGTRHFCRGVLAGLAGIRFDLGFHGWARMGVWGRTLSVRRGAHKNGSVGGVFDAEFAWRYKRLRFAAGVASRCRPFGAHCSILRFNRCLTTPAT